MTTIQALANELTLRGSKAEAHLHFEVQPIPGEVEVLKITIEDRDELPIFLSVTESEILCISYLWKESEIIAAKKAEMLEEMLELNIPMPLSAFAKIGDQYVIFGSLSIHSSITEVVHELEVLSSNAVAVIKEMTGYLQ